MTFCSNSSETTFKSSHVAQPSLQISNDQLSQASITAMLWFEWLTGHLARRRQWGNWVGSKWSQAGRRDGYLRRIWHKLLLKVAYFLPNKQTPTNFPYNCVYQLKCHCCCHKKMATCCCLIVCMQILFLTELCYDKHLRSTNNVEYVNNR